MIDEKYLVLKGVAGLGNRIDAFLGAVAFSLASRRKLVVDWGDGLYAPPNENAFLEFFSSPEIATEVGLASLERMSVAPVAWRGHLEKSVYQHPLYRAADPKSLQAVLELKKSLTIDPSLLLTYHQDVVVYYAYGFEPQLEFLKHHNIVDRHVKQLEDAIRLLLRNYLSIKPEIISAADEFQRKFFTSAHTIAVHVRNTDNQKGERFRIDTSAHLTILRRLSRKMENAGMFLATDSRATERLYQSLFPNLCIVQKSYPSDESQSLHHTQDLLDKKQSTIDTIVELLLLGRANTIIHSRKSTFAQTALRFADKPDVKRSTRRDAFRA